MPVACGVRKVSEPESGVMVKVVHKNKAIKTYLAECDVPVRPVAA